MVRPLFLQDSYSDSFGNIVCHVAGTAVIYMGNNYVAAAIGLNNGEYYYLTTNFSLPVDKFTHVALTFDGKKMRLYVNKELKDEKEAPEETGFDQYSAQQFYFFDVGRGKYNNGFIGDIDEVRISNIAREF